ncbi:dnaJ homolog subfamily C member 10-like [Ostrinia furnacalis]|uniref:dnaJ homolog subfamily C member 10-like n=1 Tax=Ostrinia furnacalis TaxID=93504 RepID=UPI00103E6880|nr:dnaJ homolog subfamily C member 10-like [Ostrinia furnacalis]
MASAFAMLQSLGRKVRGKEHRECRTLQVNMPSSSSVDIEFTNLTMKVSEGLRSKKKTILKGVSGLFRSGELTAIMGPSGAGKSSLMNALTGFSTNGVTGTIRGGDSICELDKRERSLSSLKAYRKKSCYILQDDRLNPLFTVAELMRFAADMKLGNTLNEELKTSVINDVLETLGLQGTENTRCSKLSGGQRKRLSIAVELIDNPPVVFLDEPTTGLDSSTSMQCIELLKNLARDGRTIVCTIHQPTASVYSMFDQVYILADGLCIYHGSSSNTVPYLASVGLQCPKYHNPADYILEIANGEYGKFNEFLAEKCTSQDWGAKVAPPEPLPNGKVDSFHCGKISIVVNPPHELYKFGILFRRCLIQQYRDWTVTHLKVLLHIVIGVILGLLFEQAGNDGSKTISNLGYLIVSVAYLCYTSLMPAVLKFPSELPVLKKENFNNWYNLKTYYAAILVTGIPMQIWYSFVYSAPSYFLTGQPVDFSRFLMFVMVLANVTLLADAIGNVIGTCVNPVNGTFLGAITTCAMIVFAGFLVLFAHMSPTMRIVSYGSFMRYAFEALVLTLYSGGRQKLPCPEDKPYCHTRYKLILIGFLILEVVNLSEVSYYEVLGVSKQASTQEIRQAYKKLAVKFHPDKNSNIGEEEKFLEITEAYETLKDPQKRRNYDLFGSFSSFTRRYDHRSESEYNNLFYNGLYHGDPFVDTLTGQTFYSYLNEGFHFINFYSPFCPPCQNLVEHWKKLAEIYKGIVKVGAVNCKYHNSFCYNSMRIASYPSLLFYPNGRRGNFVHYRGERTLDALDQFLMSYLNTRVHVPIVHRLRNDKPMAYVLGANRIERAVLSRVAFHLNNLINLVIVEDENLREQLTKNERTTVVFRYNEITKEIESTEEKELLRELVSSLPKIDLIGPEEFKDLRNRLRTTLKTPWIIYFSAKGHDRLQLYQMRVAFPEMYFAEMDCDKWSELCASLQVTDAPAWGVMKVGGAYQLAPPNGDLRDFIQTASEAVNLHTLSASEFTRILDGEAGMWLLVVVPHRLSWEHIAEPFTQTSLHFLDTDISFGVMACTAATDKYCRDLAPSQPVIILQEGSKRHEYNDKIDAHRLAEFIQLILDSYDLELDEQQVLEVMDSRERRNHWLVAYFPAHCGRGCSQLAHEWRRVAQKLRPLAQVRVGMLQCSNNARGFCSNVRSPSARLYPPAVAHHYTVNLQQLSEAPYILEWALEHIDDSVVKLTWHSFMKTVAVEELNPSSGKKPWLVYFHSPRCYRCYEMYADFAITGIFLQKAVNAGKVNCVNERGLCQNEQISSYPSLRLYLNRNHRQSFTSVVTIQVRDHELMIQDIRRHLIKYDENLLDAVDNIVRSQGIHAKHDEF